MPFGTGPPFLHTLHCKLQSGRHVRNGKWYYFLKVLLIKSTLLQRMKKANEISWVTFSSEHPPVGLWKKAQQSLRRSLTLSEFNQSEHAALKRAKSERSNPSSRMWSNPVKRSFLSLHKKHKEYKIENILSGRCGKLMTETKKSKEKRVYSTSLRFCTPRGGKRSFQFIRG